LTELFSQRRQNIGNLNFQFFWGNWKIKSAIGMHEILTYFFRGNLAQCFTRPPEALLFHSSDKLSIDDNTGG